MTKRFALTDKQITTAKAGKLTQLTDGMGLYLKLYFDRASGHSWRFDYKSPATGKRNTLVFGNYPAVSLKLARDKAAEARELIAQGTDPAGQREAVKAEQKAAALAVVVRDERAAKGLAAAGSLLGVAEDMHEGRLAGGAWTALHARQWLAMIKRCVPAQLAQMAIGDVKPDHILREVIRPLEAAGKDATAITVRRFLSDLFDYAERMEIRQGNPARAIRKDAKKAEHSDNLGNNPGATTPEALTVVLKAIRAWPVLITRAALQIQAALFQRPGTTCAMRWADVDLDAARWVIPTTRRTKLHKSLKGGAHIVPLPQQVVALLRTLKPVTGHSEWVFLSPSNTGKAITNDTLTNALRSMGLGEVQTAHGFRATARTMAPKFCGAVAQPQFVEAHLAHAIGMQTIDGRMVRDTLGTAYSRATWVEERAPMVQAWADYLDSLLTVETPALAAPVAANEPAALLAA